MNTHLHADARLRPVRPCAQMADDSERLAHLERAHALHRDGLVSVAMVLGDGTAATSPACVVCSQAGVCRERCPNARRMAEFRATFEYLCETAGGTVRPARPSASEVAAQLQRLADTAPDAFPGDLLPHMLSAEQRHDWSARSIGDIIAAREEWVRGTVAAYTAGDEKRSVIGARAVHALFGGHFGRLLRTDLAIINNAIEEIDPAEVDADLRGDVAKLLVLVMALYAAADTVSGHREAEARRSLESDEPPDSWGLNAEHVENGPAHPTPREGAFTAVCVARRGTGVDARAETAEVRIACGAALALQGLRLAAPGGPGGEMLDMDEEVYENALPALDAHGTVRAVVTIVQADNTSLAVMVHVGPAASVDGAKLLADMSRELAVLVPFGSGPLATCAIPHARVETTVGPYVLETCTGAEAGAWVDGECEGADTLSTLFVMRLLEDETRDGYPPLPRGTAVARALLCYRNGEMGLLGPTLEQLCVRRDMRRRGIGRFLLACVEEFVRRAWLPSERTATLQATYVTGGQGFFRRMGFVFVDAPLFEEAQKSLGRSFECTCGGCIGGFLSPRMRFRLMHEAAWQHGTLTDAVAEALEIAEAEGRAEADAVVDGDELPLSARFLPPLGPVVPAGVVRGYASIFAALHAFLENGHLVPDARSVREVCLSRGLSRRQTEARNTIAALGDAGGRVEDAIAALVDVCEEQSTGQTEADFLETYGEALAAIPACANDGCYGAVRVLLAGTSAPPRRPHSGYADGMDMEETDFDGPSSRGRGLGAALAGVARAGRREENSGDESDDGDGDDLGFTPSTAALVARIVQGAMRDVVPPVTYADDSGGDSGGES